jgi:FkbM family methyltransferase
MNLEKIKIYFDPNSILDIGANVGQFYAFAKNVFPSSNIFSIEASKECEEALKSVNPNYYIALLAKDNSEYNFYSLKSIPTNTGNSIYKETTGLYDGDNLNIIKQNGVKLDDLFTSESYFDLIKIDTQGSELDIISGGSQICSKAKGILLEVSLTQYNENAPLYDDVILFMDNFGFKVAEVLDEKIHPVVHQQDILFIKK